MHAYERADGHPFITRVHNLSSDGMEKYTSNNLRGGIASKWLTQLDWHQADRVAFTII